MILEKSVLPQQNKWNLQKRNFYVSMCKLKIIMYICSTKTQLE